MNFLGWMVKDYFLISTSPLAAPGATPASQDNTFTDSTGFPSATEASTWSQPGTASPLSVQWINTDNSLPKTSVLLINGLLS